MERAEDDIHGNSVSQISTTPVVLTLFNFLTCDWYRQDGLQMRKESDRSEVFMFELAAFLGNHKVI